MKIFQNIGFVDVRNASNDVLRDIKALRNIGVIVRYPDQLEAFANIDCQSIGYIVTVNRDESISFIIKDGCFTVDAALLSDATKSIYIIMNGSLTIDSNIPLESIKYIKQIIVNGSVLVPDNLNSAIIPLCQVNGEIQLYDGDSIYLDKDLELTDAELYSFSQGSRISVNSLRALEKIDEELLHSRLESVFVLDSLVTTKENLKLVADLVKNYSQVRKVIVPEGHQYFKKLKLDSSNLRFWKNKYIFVEKKLFIQAEAEEVLSKIQGICCNQLEAPEHIIDTIMPVINDVKNIIPLESGKLKNMSSMEIDAHYLEQIDSLFLSNYGHLTLNSDISKELFLDKVKYLENYGMIRCDNTLKPFVFEKMKNNYGVIKAFGAESKESHYEIGVHYIENTSSITL